MKIIPNVQSRARTCEVTLWQELAVVAALWPVAFALSLYCASCLVLKVA